MHGVHPPQPQAQEAEPPPQRRVFVDRRWFGLDVLDDWCDELRARVLDAIERRRFVLDFIEKIERLHHEKTLDELRASLRRTERPFRIGQYTNELRMRWPPS